MAVVGDILLTPETGWQRIDDSYGGFNYVGDWKVGGTDNLWLNNTVRISNNANAYLYFKVKTTALRVIATRYIGMADKINIEIDGNVETYSLNGANQIGTLVYEKTGLDNIVHTVKITSNVNSTRQEIHWDCIDIDDTGYLLTEDEYLQQTAQNKFPVLIGDDTITSETNIANYASTLVNGEKKLLVSSVLESIYVTDGAGGYTQVGWSMNKVNAELSTRDAKIQELEQAVNDIKASITKNTI